MFMYLGETIRENNGLEFFYYLLKVYSLLNYRISIISKLDKSNGTRQ